MNIFKRCLSLVYDKRASQRYALLGFFSGTFQLEATQRSLLVHPLDISTKGLGILADVSLELGTLLRYQNDPNLAVFEFKIAHVQPAGNQTDGRSDLIRFGLVCTSHSEILSHFSQSLSLMIQE